MTTLGYVSTSKFWLEKTWLDFQDFLIQTNRIQFKKPTSLNLISIEWPLGNIRKFSTHGLHMYSTTALLNRIFNAAFSPIVIPLMTLIMCSMVVVGIYATTRLHHRMNPIAFIPIPIIALVGGFQIGLSVPIFCQDFEISSQFQRNSYLTLTESSRQQISSQNHLLREFGARRPVRIQLLGHLYHMKRASKMVFLGGLIDSSMYLLITFWIQLNSRTYSQPVVTKTI